MHCEHLNAIVLEEWYDIPELSDMRRVKCNTCETEFEEFI